MLKHVDRCVGSLLGKATADALGAAVEGKPPSYILKQHPSGLVSYAKTERGYGCYTDDTQMAVALTRSLVAVGQVDGRHAAQCYGEDYEPVRGYGGTAHHVLQDLKSSKGSDWRETGRRYMADGSFGNGGAMRIAPVGLAYHHASKDVLTQAVEDAVSCTHVHPLGIEGAVVQAAAVAWLSNVTLAAPSGAQPQAQPPKQPRIQVDEPRRDAGSSADQQDGLHSGDDGQLVLQPHEVAPRLLQHLQWFSSSTDMQERLATLQAAAEAPAMVQWQAQQWQEWAAGGKQPASAETLLAFFKGYLHSPAWEQELSLALSLTPPSFDGFQIRATDAVATSLCALLHHGCGPEPARAVVSCIHYGGDTDTTAAMTGALVGALHGARWLPPEWVSDLEDGHSLGKTGILRLAEKLAQLDVREALAPEEKGDQSQCF